MDSSVIAALARWPNVPSVFGWLRLDRRGNWLIRDERVRQPALTGFINRNYAGDERGRYFFQNGPQRVYASLDYTPWVVRLEQDRFINQTGEIVAADEVLLDDEGSILIVWADQAGLLDDRDLPATLACLRHSDGSPADDAAVMQTIDQGEANLVLDLNGRLARVAAIRHTEVATRFGFDPAPLAD